MYCTNSGQLHPRILNNSLTGVKYAQIFFPYPIFHRNLQELPYLILCRGLGREQGALATNLIEVSKKEREGTTKSWR
jgi:hypothetical protein